jgi:hypothetical protein
MMRMVMPELSILFTKKNKQNSLMEGWFYNRSSILGTKRKITNHQTTIYFYAKKSTKRFTQL